MKTLVTIRNCTVTIKPCPLKWSDLKETEVDSIRHCTWCDKNVYFCKSDNETLKHTALNRCIARETPDFQHKLGPDIHMGQGSTVFVDEVEEAAAETVVEKEEYARANSWAAREAGIDEAIRRKNPSSVCPNCRFPTSVYRKNCKVCGRQLLKAQSG